MSQFESVDRSAPRGLRASIGFSVLTGLVSAVPVGRTPRWVLRSVATICGVSLSAAGLVAVRGAAEPDQPVNPRHVAVPIAAGVVTGGAALGVLAASVAMDRGMEAALTRRGVARPRLVLGVAAGVMSFALDRLDQRVGRARGAS